MLDSILASFSSQSFAVCRAQLAQDAGPLWFRSSGRESLKPSVFDISWMLISAWVTLLRSLGCFRRRQMPYDKNNKSLLRDLEKGICSGPVCDIYEQREQQWLSSKADYSRKHLRYTLPGHSADSRGPRQFVPTERQSSQSKTLHGLGKFPSPSQHLPWNDPIYSMNVRGFWWKQMQKLLIFTYLSGTESNPANVISILCHSCFLSAKNNNTWLITMLFALLFLCIEVNGLE